MAVQICPECGAICQETDTHCMDCGCDIAEAERAITRRAKEDRGGGPAVGDAHTIEGAAAGMAEPGETSEKVRLKQFDRHMAERLERERAAVIITAIIALVIGAAILLVGLKVLQSAGGVEALRSLEYSDLRLRGFGAFVVPGFYGLLTLLLGLAGLLCAVGQIRRVILANRAIAQVKRGERPELVGISQLTWIGLLIASFVAPPLGIVLGIIFVLSKDESTRLLGSQMIKSAILAILIVVAHLIWNLIADLASREPAAPTVSPDAD
ncbi:MAG: hypothetical protein ACOX9R_18405 [Armatimonadota bacterium]|jgi:hypothetical protein